MTAVLIVLFLVWIAALGLLATINGRYWRRVHQSRIVWTLLLLGSSLLPFDSLVARVAAAAVLGGFFILAARPAVLARRSDIDVRRAAETEARGGASQN